MRPQLGVADILRSAGADFIERNRSWLRWTHLTERSFVRLLLSTAVKSGSLFRRCGYALAF
jgi:hypothetical protein